MKYIKLFEEHNYSVYDLITMGANQVLSLLIEEIKEEYPDLKLIKDILEYSVIDINSKDENGYTPLKLAASRGEAKCVEALLNHPEIDVNLQDKWGNTALMNASMYGREKCVELLLNHPGIDVNVQNLAGWSALMRATYNVRIECIKLLLKHPEIDRSLKTEDDKTAWDLANHYIHEKFPQLNPNV
jgi:ankyrin repeat protein